MKNPFFQYIIAGGRYIHSIGTALLLGSLALVGGVIMVPAKEQVEEVPKAKAKKQRRKVPGPTLAKWQEKTLRCRINTYKALQRLPGLQRKASPQPLSKENKPTPDILIAQMAQLQKEGAHEDAIQAIRYKLYHTLKGDEALMVEQFFAENDSSSITEHVEITAYSDLFSQRVVLYKHKSPYESSLICFTPGRDNTLQDLIHYLLELYVEEAEDKWVSLSALLDNYDFVMPIREQKRLASLLQKKERIAANLEKLKMRYDQYKITDEAFFPKKRLLYKRAKKNKIQINALLRHCGIPTPVDVEDLRWDAEKEVIKVYVYDCQKEYIPNLQGPKIYVHVDRDPEDPRAIPELQATTPLEVPNYKLQTNNLYRLSHYITHMEGKAKHYVFKKGNYYLTTQVRTSGGGTRQVTRQISQSIFYKKMVYADIFCYTILKTDVLRPPQNFIDLVGEDVAEVLIISWPFMVAVTVLSLILFYTRSGEGTRRPGEEKGRQEGRSEHLRKTLGSVKGGGLQNHDNTCFYNSWLQFLHNTGLHKNFYPGGLDGEDNKDLKAIMEGLDKKEVFNKNLYPQYLKDMNITNMTKGAQHDPTEVMGQLWHKASENKNDFMVNPLFQRSTLTSIYENPLIKSPVGSTKVDPIVSLRLKPPTSNNQKPHNVESLYENECEEEALDEDNLGRKYLKELLTNKGYKGDGLQAKISELKKSMEYDDVTKCQNDFIKDISNASDEGKEGKDFLNLWWSYPVRKMKSVLTKDGINIELAKLKSLKEELDKFTSEMIKEVNSSIEDINEDASFDKFRALMIIKLVYNQKIKLPHKKEIIENGRKKLTSQKKEKLKKSLENLQKTQNEFITDFVKNHKNETKEDGVKTEEETQNDLPTKLLDSYIAARREMFEYHNKNIFIKSKSSTRKVSYFLNLKVLKEHWNSVLVVSFNRTQFTGNTQKGSRGNLPINVADDFHIPYVNKASRGENKKAAKEGQKCGTATMELLGIIHHYGDGIDYGHYFVSARKREKGKNGKDTYTEKFWRFNDSSRPYELKDKELNSEKTKKEVCMAWYRLKSVENDDN